MYNYFEKDERRKNSAHEFKKSDYDIFDDVVVAFNHYTAYRRVFPNSIATKRLSELIKKCMDAINKETIIETLKEFNNELTTAFYHNGTEKSIGYVQRRIQEGFGIQSDKFNIPMPIIADAEQIAVSPASTIIAISNQKINKEQHEKVEKAKIEDKIEAEKVTVTKKQKEKSKKQISDVQVEFDISKLEIQKTQEKQKKTTKSKYAQYDDKIIEYCTVDENAPPLSVSKLCELLELERSKCDNSIKGRCIWLCDAGKLISEPYGASGNLHYRKVINEGDNQKN